MIPAIWLAFSSVIYSRITLFFAPNRVILVLNHFISVLNRTIFALYRIISVSNTEWDVKAFLFPLFYQPATRSLNIRNDWILRFQNGCNKVVIELRVVQFWSEIILVISNRTLPARSSDFEITRMILDRIHSTQFNHYYVYKDDFPESICSSRQRNRLKCDFWIYIRQICPSSCVRMAIVSYPKRTTRPTRLRYLLCLNFILSFYLFRKD